MRKLLSTFLAWLACASLAQAQVMYSGQSIPSRGPVPADSIGVENSWYLDLLTGNVYGPKTLGHWPTPPAAYLSIAQNIPITGFGAKFDTLAYSDGTTTAGSTTFTSASATFTSADCNSGPGCTGPTDKSIDIDFAGPAGGPLHTTITTVLDAHTVILATPATASTGYLYAYYWTVSTAQSGAGSYAPGDTVTLSGGTFTSPAVAIIDATKAVSATIVSGGSGGVAADGTSSGSCQLQGTTGVGPYFIFNATLTAGVITSIDSVNATGAYRTNPTNLASEPVVPVNTCSSLTGAVLSVKMGPIVLHSASHATSGVYSAFPSLPAATTTSGSGTGFLATPVAYRAGNFFYGTDDTLAWTNAANYSQQLTVAGKPNCITLPAGGSILTASLPLWTQPPCIHGVSRERTTLFISSVLSGAVMTTSNTWVLSSQNTPEDGSLAPATSVPLSVSLTDFQMIATRFSPNLQHGLLLADNNDYFYLHQIQFRGFNGTCFGIGQQVNPSTTFNREARVDDVYIQYCGSHNNPAFYVQGVGSAGAADDIYFTNVNIYGSRGIGAQLRADGSATVKALHFDRLRVEGEGAQPDPTAEDLLVIGDDTLTGRVFNVVFDKLELIDPNLNRNALRLDAPVGGKPPAGIAINGEIIGGLPLGRGIYINAGFTNSLHFTVMNTIDTNLTTTATAGGGNQVTGVGCNERSWTKSLTNPIYTYPCYITTNSTAGSVSFGPSDGTINGGGNRLPTGSVNLSTVRSGPYFIPGGFNSASIASSNGKSTGDFSVDIASRQTVLSGTYSSAISSYFPIDYGWQSTRIMSGFSTSGAFGGNQLQEVILGCRTAATNSATCRLTSDGTGTASTTNIANPGANTSWSGNMVCNAHDSTNNTNAIAWVNIPALFLRQTTAASTQASFGAVPTPLTIGTTTGATLTPTADTTNGGASLVFKAPNVNSANWDITCHAPTVQTN